LPEKERKAQLGRRRPAGWVEKIIIPKTKRYGEKEAAKKGGLTCQKGEKRYVFRGGIKVSQTTVAVNKYYELPEGIGFKQLRCGIRKKATALASGKMKESVKGKGGRKGQHNFN